MSLYRFNPHSRAYSLIEAAIVLGIAGVIIAGVWVSSSALSENYKQQSMIDGIEQIVLGMQGAIPKELGDAYANNTSFTSLAIQSGYVPADWIKGSTIVTPYGSTLTIRNIAGGGSSNLGLVIGAIPREACIKFLVRITTIAAQSGSRGGGNSERPALGYISVNNPAWSTTTFPVSLATASDTACSQATNTFLLSYGYARPN